MGIKLEGLDRWLNVDTWYTAHPADDERFYKAVNVVLGANLGRFIDASDIKEYIEARYKGKLEDSFLTEESQRAAERFETIQDYCRTNNLL